MQRDLVEYLRKVMNSGPFGFSVSYSGVAGSEVVYAITTLELGEEVEKWTLETREAAEQIDCILIEAMNGAVSDVAMQSALYTALLIEQQSVVKESTVEPGLAEILEMRFPVCYTCDRPQSGGK